MTELDFPEGMVEEITRMGLKNVPRTTHIFKVGDFIVIKEGLWTSFNTRTGFIKSLPSLYDPHYKIIMDKPYDHSFLEIDDTFPFLESEIELNQTYLNQKKIKSLLGINED